jgi:hypothetical protein
MARAIDLIVQIRRLANGKREVSEIMELVGMEGEVITRSTIFERDKTGSIVPTGYVPRILNKINQHKSVIQNSFFNAQSEKKTA